IYPLERSGDFHCRKYHRRIRRGEKQMENEMFCFQCEQRAGCAACTGNAGDSRKKSETADLQDELTGALVGLARAARGDTDPAENTYKVLIEGLFTTVTNVSFDDEAIRRQIEAVRKEKERLV